MTALITIIILFLASAMTAGAFVFGRQIGYTQRDAEEKTKELTSMQAQIEQMQLEYMQLETQYKQEKYDNQRQVNPGGWDPGQLSSR